MSDVLQPILTIGQVTCPQYNPAAEMSDILQPVLTVNNAVAEIEGHMHIQEFKTCFICPFICSMLITYSRCTELWQ